MMFYQFNNFLLMFLRLIESIEEKNVRSILKQKIKKHFNIYCI
jgi:hypothetical protein